MKLGFEKIWNLRIFDRSHIINLSLQAGALKR